MNRGRRALAAALLVFGTLSVWLITSPRLSAAPTDTTCMGGPATITGDNDAAPGDGTITGTEGNDVILGSEANDRINGGPGDDRICGLGGEDTLEGGDGFD